MTPCLASIPAPFHHAGRRRLSAGIHDPSFRRRSDGRGCAPTDGLLHPAASRTREFSSFAAVGISAIPSACISIVEVTW